MNLKKILYLATVLSIPLVSSCGKGESSNSPRTSQDTSYEQKYRIAGPASALKEIKEIGTAQELPELEKIDILTKRLIENFPDSQEAIEAKTLSQITLSKIKKIHDEQAAIEKQKITKLKQLIKTSFKLQADDMADMKFYTHKTFATNTRTQIAPYISVSKSNFTFLRFTVRYFGDNWLFIKEMTIKCGDKKEDISFSQFGSNAIKRDNAYGKVWEWSDTLAGPDEKSILKCVADPKNTVKYRFTGQDYYKDITMPKEHQKAIKETLELYEGYPSLVNT